MYAKSSKKKLACLTLSVLYIMPNAMHCKEATAVDLKHWVNTRHALWGGDPDQLVAEAQGILSSSTVICLLAATDAGKYIGFIEVSLRHTQNHTYG